MKVFSIALTLETIVFLCSETAENRWNYYKHHLAEDDFWISIQVDKDKKELDIEDLPLMNYNLDKMIGDMHFTEKLILTRIKPLSAEWLLRFVKRFPSLYRLELHAITWSWEKDTSHNIPQSDPTNTVIQLIIDSCSLSVANVVAITEGFPLAAIELTAIDFVHEPICLSSQVSTLTNSIWIKKSGSIDSEIFFQLLELFPHVQHFGFEDNPPLEEAKFSELLLSRNEKMYDAKTLILRLFGITDESFMSLLKLFPKLTVLDVSKKDLKAEFFVRIILSHPKLQEFWAEETELSGLTTILHNEQNNWKDYFPKRQLALRLYVFESLMRKEDFGSLQTICNENSDGKCQVKNGKI